MTMKKAAKKSTKKTTAKKATTKSKAKSITIPIPTFNLKAVAIWLVLGLLIFSYAKNELPKYFGTKTAIEKKAASGVADIPFSNVVPSPTPSGLPPIGSTPGQASSTPTNTSEKSSQYNPTPPDGRSSSGTSPRRFRMFRR